MSEKIDTQLLVIRVFPREFSERMGGTPEDGMRTIRSLGLKDYHVFRQLLRHIPSTRIEAHPYGLVAGSKLKILITGQRGMIIIARLLKRKRLI